MEFKVVRRVRVFSIAALVIAVTGLCMPARAAKPTLATTSVSAAAPPAGAAAAAVPTPPAPARITSISWLSGCWSFSTSDRTVSENWAFPRDTTMLEMGMTERGGKLVEYEFVVVREDGDHLAYQAHPSGQASAIFKSTTLGPSSVVFENLDHDFPQRVGYERKSADTLLAWIEGTRDGKTRRIEFPYKRESCTVSMEGGAVPKQ